MSKKKKIVICWNDNGYADKLNEAFAQSEDYSVTVCRSFEELENTINPIYRKSRKLKRYDGFVVLCELQWDHKTTGADYSEFQGISFVQGYLRRKLGLKAPVVFTSFMDAKAIVEQKPVYSIIMTPAMQHKFVRLPSQPEALVEPFAKMCFMSDEELVYTQMQYCDFRGLLKQIKHNVEGHLEQKEKYHNQIRYIIENQFKDALDYHSLMNECEQATDLSAFCDQLLNRFVDTTPISGEENMIDFNFACKNEMKQISILILEDDNDDENVLRFIRYIEERNKEYAQRGVCFLFKEPMLVANKDDFDWYVQYGTRAEGGEFDVVICDIEIKNSDGFLVSLGFNLVKDIVKLRKKPIYYIVTNVSRSFYDQIKTDYISRVRLKKEVFGTDESIRTFLYGIKEGNEQKRLIYGDSDTDAEELFNNLMQHVKTKQYRFKYKNLKTGEQYELKSYEEIENVVKSRSSELVKAFLGFFSTNGFDFAKGDIRNYKPFNENCKRMRVEYIKEYVGVGNDKWLTNYDKYSDFSNVDLSNFTIRLILRRFYFYVREFVKYYAITESANAIQKLADSHREISDSDIACRAINTDCKALNVSKHNNDLEPGYKTQTHCFDKILFFSEKRDPEDKYYTIEEKAFLEYLADNKEVVFCYDKIEKLELYN